MRKTLILLGVAFVLGACGYVSEYEKGVYDYEPVYCYQSLAGIRCFDKPNHRDERRLVNYYGPAPSRYDKPAPPPAPQLFAPPPVDFYVRDPEPVPEPAPVAASPLPPAAAPVATAVTVDLGDNPAEALTVPPETVEAAPATPVPATVPPTTLLPGDPE